MGSSAYQYRPKKKKKKINSVDPPSTLSTKTIDLSSPILTTSCKVLRDPSGDISYWTGVYSYLGFDSWVRRFYVCHL